LPANIFNGGSLALSNTEIAHAATYGLYTSAGTTTIISADIHDNSYGIYITGGTVTASSSTIYNNSTYGAYKTGSPTSTMKNNYWGGWTPIDYDPDKNPGPEHTGSNPDGAGNDVSNYIDFEPYIVAYLYDPANASTSPPAVNFETYEMRWSSSTQYLTEWEAAVDTWNASTSGAVNIHYATSSADLVVDDVYRDDVIWAGYWYPIGESGLSSAKIELNEYRLDGQSSTTIQNVAAHELGHALGLAHSTGTNVMVTPVMGIDYLGTQDIYDYEFLWSSGYLWK
jgi:hypothetical protein